MAGTANAVEAKAAAINLLIWIPFSIVRANPARTTPAVRSWELSSAIFALAAREGEVKIYAVFIIWTIVAIRPQLGRGVKAQLNRRGKMGVSSPAKSRRCGSPVH